MFTSFTLTLFLTFSNVSPYIASFFNSYNTFPSLPLFFFCFYSFFASWIQKMILTIAIDWILIRDVLFLVLVIVSSKVLDFHNEAHTSLSKKLGTNFLELPIGILYQSASLIDIQTAFIIYFSFIWSEPLCNSRNSLGYSGSSSRTHPFESFIVYLV